MFLLLLYTTTDNDSVVLAIRSDGHARSWDAFVSQSGNVELHQDRTTFCCGYSVELRRFLLAKQSDGRYTRHQKQHQQLGEEDSLPVPIPFAGTIPDGR
jgi:hypothetical protein